MMVPPFPQESQTPFLCLLLSPVQRSLSGVSATVITAGTMIGYFTYVSPLVFVFPVLVSHCAFSVGLCAPAVRPHVHAVPYLQCCHCLHLQHLPMQATLTGVISLIVMCALLQLIGVQPNFKQQLFSTVQNREVFFFTEYNRNIVIICYWKPACVE